MSATRLPGKPLLKINGISIITHVFKRAEKADIGEVIVATEDQEIIDEVKKNGGNAILTSKKNKTGTDRIYEGCEAKGDPDEKLTKNKSAEIKDKKHLSKSTKGTKNNKGYC